MIEFKSGQRNSGYIVHENETTIVDDVRAAAVRDIHRKSEVHLQSGHHPLKCSCSLVLLPSTSLRVTRTRVLAKYHLALPWRQTSHHQIRGRKGSQSSTTLTSESDREASSASARLVDPYEDPLVQCISAIGAALSRPSNIAEPDYYAEALSLKHGSA